MSASPGPFLPLELLIPWALASSSEFEALQTHMFLMWLEPFALLSDFPDEMPLWAAWLTPACFCRCPVHGQCRSQHQWLPVLHLHHKD